MAALWAVALEPPTKERADLEAYLVREDEKRRHAIAMNNYNGPFPILD